MASINESVRPLPGHRPAYSPRRSQADGLPRDVVLIGELRANQRSITRNTLLALCGSVLVCTTAVLATGQQSGLLAGLIGAPLGLRLGAGASQWLNSEARARHREIEEQLHR